MMMNFLAWYVPVTVVVTLWSLASVQCEVSSDIKCTKYTAEGLSAKDVKYHKYAVIIDAGSTSSKVHIYRWKNEESSSLLPDFIRVSSCRLGPAIHTLGENNEIKEHVRALLEAAKPHVPGSELSKTPIYFMGTAGMRLKEESWATDVTEMIQMLFETNSDNPFLYTDRDNIRILSGEEEGIFAWIAANYVNNIFPKEIDDNDKDETKTVKTHGILDLGGASTQIAFCPIKGNILANKYPAKVAGKKYSLYVHSYLSYGINEVEEWVRRQIYTASGGDQTTLDDPCLVKGHSLDKKIDDKSLTFEGKGNADGCLKLLEQLIYKPTEPWQCNPSPCAIGTTYQPTINKTKEFYVTGIFLYALNVTKVLKADGKFSLTDLKNSAKTFCSTPLADLEKKLDKTADLLSKDCLTSLYMLILFQKGYGFTADTTQLQVVTQPIQEMPDWSVGAVIYEYERRRCDVTGSLAHGH